MVARAPIASVLIRTLPHYQATAFQAGIRRAGYDVRTAFPPRIEPQDVLVIWNRHGVQHEYANRFEAAGARVVVVENGYVGHGNYAIAQGYHNGAGVWNVREQDRWGKLGIEVKPWRTDGRHILVLAQRGVGPPGLAQPPGWVGRVMTDLKHLTDRPVRLREHPGKDKPPLEPDLKDCWCVVTWGSGAALKAIVAGVPVVHCLETWIGAPAAVWGLGKTESLFTGDRSKMLHSLAWAQWSLAEIESGEAFRTLLEAPI